jgi:hypothetical protein
MIHEFGTENGIDFLVMELVAGENTSQPPMRFNHLFTIVPSGMKTTCREAVLHAHLSKISMPPESSNCRVPTMGSARTAWHDAARSIAGWQAHVNEEIKEISWKAQQRLHQRYRKLLAKGKNKGVVMTAVGRELLGFIWAIGIQAETAQKEPLRRAA